VAVRAHELAFRDVFEHATAVVLPTEIGDGSQLVGTRQMVPLHRGRVVGPAAVGTRLPLFEGEIPGDELGVTRSFLLDP
jgi:hypothetical protein